MLRNYQKRNGKEWSLIYNETVLFSVSLSPVLSAMCSLGTIRILFFAMTFNILQNEEYLYTFLKRKKSLFMENNVVC